MTEQLWDGKTIGFGPQTMIDTTEGPVPIEWLSTTHRVITRDHGPQPILTIRQHVLHSLDGDYLPLVEIASNAFQGSGPDHPLLLPPHHRILLEGQDIELHFGMEAALCHASHLLDGTRITRHNITGRASFYSVLLSCHEVVRANGIWVETEEVTPDSAHVSIGALSLDIFAKLKLEGGAHRRAHPCLEAWEGRLLARQHASSAPLQLTRVA